MEPDFINKQIIKTCWIRKVLPLYIACCVQNHTEIKFRWAMLMAPKSQKKKLNAKWSICIIYLIEKQLIYRFGYMPAISSIDGPNCETGYCVSAGARGHMGHANVVHSKSGWSMTNNHDIILPVTVKRESITYMRDQIYKENLSHWC